MSRAKQKKRAEKKQRVKRTIVNGVVITLVITFTILLLLTVGVYYLTRDKNGQVAYPVSPLTKMINQSYSYIEDETLNIQFQFPSIPVIVNLGGTERFMSDNGLVFRYNNDLSISLYEIEGSAYDLLSTEYGPNLYNGELSGNATYIPDVNTMDVGYCNSFPAEYQCGVIQVADNNNVVYRTIYAITMVVDMGYEKDVFISISTTDVSKLYDAELLLESIVYTLMDISITQDSIAEDNLLEEQQSQAVSVEEEIANVTQTTNNKGFEYMNIEVPLVKSYENGAIVVLQYTNIDADMTNVTLLNYNKTMIKGRDAASTPGVAYFVIDNATKGNYTLQVPITTDIGVYSARTLSYEEFIQEYGSIIIR